MGLSSWCMAAMYDLTMRGAEKACLGGWRAELLRGVGGDVLEVGAGTGVNLPLYPRGLRRIAVSEPDPNMRKRLERKFADSKDVDADFEVIDAGVESLPVDAESFDWVVATLVLCSVRDLAASLAEVRRVLRPGGGLLFLEHVADEENPRCFAWQRRLEPIWIRLAGNCHLTRKTGKAIESAGFDFETCVEDAMKPSLPVVRRTIRGVARKRA